MRPALVRDLAKADVSTAAAAGEEDDIDDEMAGLALALALAPLAIAGAGAGAGAVVGFEVVVVVMLEGTRVEDDAASFFLRWLCRLSIWVSVYSVLFGIGCQWCGGPR